MSWRARLAERRSETFSESAGAPTDKTDESPFVAFVSDPNGPFENSAPDPARLVACLKSLRAQLLALAAAAGVDRGEVHRLNDADLAGCVGLDHRQLAAYVAALADSADREAGRVPAGDTAPILCAHCGPVWAHPSIAAALPMVGGWPRAAGCPWCHVRKAGGYIPRPPVSCGGCLHFVPDTLNPTAAMGACQCGHGSHFASECHRCETFNPDKGTR